MKLSALLLPMLAAGLAAVALDPSPAEGFELLGGALRLEQRDLRVFDNFTDPEAHTNLTPHLSFPGATDVELAVWKAAVEWGSELHGDGEGDPHQPRDLGSGAANFDYSWQGQALDPGGPDDNVISETAAGSAGVLAFTELPIGDGWRIRFHRNPWRWHDAPAAQLSGGFDRDLQAIATHELGHALGLDHTGVAGATMNGTIPHPDTPLRSIEPDDVAGLQFLYGVRAPDKPHVATYRLAAGATVEILGQNFGSSNEVWFTPAAAGGDGSPLRVRGVRAGPDARRIVVAIPPAAGPGDLLVRRQGQAYSDLSNAFPFDPTRNPCPGPVAYGTGKTSSAGTEARLDWFGQPSLTTQDFAFRLSGLPAGSAGLLLWSGGPANLPFAGGSLLVAQPLHRGPTFTTDFIGFATVPFPVDPLAVDRIRFYQAWFADAADPFGAGTTNGVRVPFCP